jgi:hypothetical protein
MHLACQITSIMSSAEDGSALSELSCCTENACWCLSKCILPVKMFVGDLLWLFPTDTSPAYSWHTSHFPLIPSRQDLQAQQQQKPELRRHRSHDLLPKMLLAEQGEQGVLATHTHKRTPPHTQTHTQADTHTQTHTYTHKRTPTHTHTQTYSYAHERL